jgi:hypothetical protein
MSHEPTGREIAEANVLKSIIFGDDLMVDTTDDDVADPVAQFFEAAPVRVALGKSDQRPSILLDMAVPADDVDSDDNSPFYKAPKILPGGLAQRSDEHFVKVLAKIRSVFAGHPEEMAEAIETATRIRDAARLEAMALAAK